MALHSTLPSEIFPKGLKIQEKRGAGELQPLLNKLKRYTFNGYLKIDVDGQLEGYITLKDGMPRNAILVTPSKREITGLDAFQKIQGLDGMKELHIEVRTNVDIERLIEKAPGRLPTVDSDDDEYYVEIQEEELKDIIESELKDELEKERNVTKDIEETIRESEREEKESKVYERVVQVTRGEPVEEETVFSDKYSFNTFIVGSSNEFAHAAALEAARFPGGKFNPLFITSPAGLGKTHLLKSIGNYIQKAHPKLKVGYTSTSSFALEVYQTGDNRTIDSYKELDVILIDDVQFLAEKDEVQEELFHIFNHIKDKNGQIVITCDRSPESIPALEDRLVSRFKSGLVVDIGQPNFETRRAIVDKILNDHDLDLEEELKDYIAENITKNIREIEGALNRILAFSSLLKQEININTVKEMLRTHVHEESVREDKKRISFKPKPGRSYLIESSETPVVYHLLKQILKDDPRGLYIFSRINPERVRREYKVTGGEVYWLTARESHAQRTVPPNLESLTWRLEEIIREENIVLLDGLEYLISTSGFEAAIQFIRHMVDSVSETGCTLLLPVNPDAFEKKQLSLLEREMEVVSN